MNNKNEINRAPAAPQKTIPFRVSDNEIYMIRENSIKRIHDVMKNSYNAKPNPDCNVRFYFYFLLFYCFLFKKIKIIL